MKILFLNSDKFVNSGDKLVSGGWTYSLIHNLVQNDDIEVGVTYPSLIDIPVEDDKISYFPIVVDKKTRLISKIMSKLPYFSGEAENYYDQKYLQIVKSRIQQFKPDIIHVWGFETRNVMISNYTDIPIVIHIQGILSPYFNIYFPPKVSLLSAVISLFPNISKIYLLLKSYRAFYRHTIREQKYAAVAKYVMGRTEWDKNVSRCLAPHSKYFYCSEMLRPLFVYSQKWEYHKRSKLIIQSSISANYYKGHDVILRAAMILKNIWGDNFEWRICGTTDMKKFESMVGISTSDVNVICLGKIGAEDVQKRLLECDVYCHLSYIENSPNSVCEAQYLGVPVVATDTGGTSTLLKNNSGIIVPINDAYQAAVYITKIKNSQELSNNLRENAIKEASVRHDPKQITNNLLNSYNSIVNSKVYD